MSQRGEESDIDDIKADDDDDDSAWVECASHILSRMTD